MKQNVWMIHLKTSKTFQRHIDAMIEKMEAILNKFTILCQTFLLDIL